MRSNPSTKDMLEVHTDSGVKAWVPSRFLAEYQASIPSSVEDASSYLVTSDAPDSHSEDQESHPLTDPNSAPETTSLDFQTSFLVKSIKLLNSSIRSKSLIIPHSEEIMGVAYRVGCMVTFC
jgi:hypothetical protein